MAEELQLKGLRGNQTQIHEEVFQEQAATQRLPQRSPDSRSLSKKNAFKKNVSPENRLGVHGENDKALAQIDETTNTTGVESLDRQVKSMMTFSESAGPKGQGKARICKVCGKEGGMRNIMNHIEAKHIDGISIPCDFCEKLCTSRNALSYHKHLQHRNKEIN